MPRPPLYVSRSDLGWGSSPATRANPRSGLVIHYDSADQGLARKDHSACLQYWRDTRSFHTGPSRGWADIAYSFMSCAHGYVLEGRGLYKTQAAQPGGNTTHYSVTLATGPTDTITPEQINAVRALRQWLMEPDTSIAGTVLGHRDFVATSCPGDRAYDLVEDGTFTQPPGAITDTDQMGMTSMLGLREGDKGPRVQDLQLFLHEAGFSPANSYFDGWDGVYGKGVSDAVLDARRSVGSTVSDGTVITYWATNQLRQAWFREQYRLARAADGGPTGTAPAPSLEGATLTATVTRVEA
ncbi:peptidoglycan recognition protein family protein [Nocardiopsis dassonvillei]|uniref:peptidoglycan recognition protein family protein n=1 Tax=Nocardiopsis dassonvillei TaxID=2014 RepID=UPI0036276206